MKLLYRRENQRAFSDALNIIALTRNACSSLYSPKNSCYREILSRSGSSFFEDLSCIVVGECGPCFAFIGFFSSRESRPIIACGDIPCAIFESQHITKNLRKEILQFFLILLKSYACPIHLVNAVYDTSSMLLEDLYLSYPESVSFSANRVILLDQPIDVVRSHFRKSYKPLISKSCKLFDISIMHGSNSNFSVFEEFIALHKDAAGRITRPIETWLAQYESVKHEEAFCVFSRIKQTSELASAALFTVGYNHAYYGVSASRRSLAYLPLSHSVIFHALSFAEKLDVHIFQIDSVHLDPATPQSAKVATISKFKAGFGGNIRFDPRITLSPNHN